MRWRTGRIWAHQSTFLRSCACHFVHENIGLKRTFGPIGSAFRMHDCTLVLDALLVVTRITPAALSIAENNSARFGNNEARVCRVVACLPIAQKRNN